MSSKHQSSKERRDRQTSSRPQAGPSRAPIVPPPPLPQAIILADVEEGTEQLVLPTLAGDTSTVKSIDGFSIQDQPLPEPGSYRFDINTWTPSTSSKPNKDDSVLQMSKPTLFYGKPTQLDDVITSATVIALASGKTSDNEKSAVLAASFKGVALSWLTDELRKNPQLFANYDEFLELVKKTFGLDQAAAKTHSARKLAKCEQRTSVQEYALRFKIEASKCQLNEETSIAYFLKGLKNATTAALITSDDYTTLDTCIEEAIRIDSQTFAARHGVYPRNVYSSNKRGRRTGKFKREQSSY